MIGLATTLWVVVVSAFFLGVLFSVSMALAAPVAALIGLANTFLVAGLVPIFVAVVAIVWARLPADEIAHPLR